MEFDVRNLGNCLTERKVKDFDEQVKKYTRFVNIDQWTEAPKNIRPYLVMRHKFMVTDRPVLSSANRLFGIEENGDLTLLGEIIDSSD